MLPQCHSSSAHICPACPNDKRPIIVKGSVTGVLSPCSVVAPPQPPVAISSFLCDGFGPDVTIDGTGLVGPCFTASYVGEPTTVTLCNDAGFADETIALPATSFCSAHTYNLTAPGSVTWTLKAGDSSVSHTVNFVEPPLVLTSFECDGFGPIVTQGAGLVQPCFTFSYTGLPTMIQLANDAGFPTEDIPFGATSFCSAHTYPDTAGTSVNWTLILTDSDDTVQDTHGVTFIAPALNITSFTSPDFDADTPLGDPGLDQPCFDVTFDTVPTTVTFTDNKGNAPYTVPGPYSTSMNFCVPYSYSPNASGTICDFTVTADNGGPSDSETIQTQFICDQFIGWLLGAGAGDDAPYTAADILGMQELQTIPTTDALFNVTLTPDPGAAGGDVYVVQAFCCDVDTTRAPTDYRIGGAFPGGFVELPNLVINGVTYCIWRTSIDQDGVPTGGVQYEAFQ